MLEDEVCDGGGESAEEGKRQWVSCFTYYIDLVLQSRRYPYLQSHEYGADAIVMCSV